MAFWDSWFTSADDPSLGSAGQAEYLQSLGQQVPSGVTFEGSNTPISTPEQQQLFPSGIPSPQHSGALADLARASSSQPPPQAQQPPPSSGAATTAQPSGRGAPGSRVWATGAAPAQQKMAHEWRQVGATGNLAHAAGTLVRMAATMGAGGAAGGAMGGAGGAAGAAGATGAADAAGTAAGASSAAGGAAGAAGGSGASGFGGGFLKGIMGQGSGGGMSSIMGGTATSGDYGSMLGSLARRELSSSGGGGGGGGGAAGGGGGGGGFNPAGVEQSNLGAGSGKMSGGVQKLIGMVEMSPERAWANQLLADTSDQMVSGEIPWAQG